MLTFITQVLVLATAVFLVMLSLGALGIGIGFLPLFGLAAGGVAFIRVIILPFL